MVQGKHKSRTMRRVDVKTPGSRITRHHKLRKPDFAKCQETGVKLHGTKRARPNEMQDIPHSARAPQRPYGGVLSSKAARARNVAEARTLNE